MKTKLKIIICTFLATSLLYITIWSSAAGFGVNNSSISNKINEIQNLIDKNAIMEFDRDKAEFNALYSYVTTLEDNYAIYFEPEEYADYIDEGKGNFTGIGLYVQAQSGNITDGIYINRVIGNSPAEKAGVKSNDVIIKIGDTTIDGVDYQKAVDMLLGLEDSYVDIVVRRGESELLTFTVKREHFTQREVDFRIIENDIGFIRIHDFNTIAYSEFENALNELLKQNVKGFIFDVRNNLGGELNTVKSMIDLLIPEDELVVLKYKDDEIIYYSTPDRKTELPMVVLTNKTSASASELFSSALRDVIKVPLVGTSTWGKGIGQTTFKLSDGSGVKLTTFKYFTKSRTDYNQIGLKPDYEVTLSEEKLRKFYSLDETNDDQLIKAIEVLRKSL